MLLAVRRAGRGRGAAARSCRRSAPLSLCGLALGAGRRPSGPCLPGRGPGPLPCQRPQLWAARARHLFPRTWVKVRRMPKRPGHLGRPGGAPPCIRKAKVLIRPASRGGGRTRGAAAAPHVTRCSLLTHCWPAHGWPEASEPPRLSAAQPRAWPHSPRTGRWQPTQAWAERPGRPLAGRGGCAWACVHGAGTLVASLAWFPRAAPPTCAHLRGGHRRSRKATCASGYRAPLSTGPAPLPSPGAPGRSVLADTQGLGLGLQTRAPRPSRCGPPGSPPPQWGPSRLPRRDLRPEARGRGTGLALVAPGPAGPAGSLQGEPPGCGAGVWGHLPPTSPTRQTSQKQTDRTASLAPPRRTRSRPVAALGLYPAPAS